MEMIVKDKEYTLKFGYLFSKKMDEVYRISQKAGDGGQAIELDFGITMLSTYLNMANFSALVNFYTAGLAHLQKRPSPQEVINFCEDLALEKGLKQACEDAVEALIDSGFYKGILDGTPQKKEKA